MDAIQKRERNYAGMIIPDFADFAALYTFVSGCKIPESWIIKGRASKNGVSTLLRTILLTYTGNGLVFCQWIMNWERDTMPVERNVGGVYSGWFDHAMVMV